MSNRSFLCGCVDLYSCDPFWLCFTFTSSANHLHLPVMLLLPYLRLIASVFAMAYSYLPLCLHCFRIYVPSLPHPTAHMLTCSHAHIYAHHPAHAGFLRQRSLADGRADVADGRADGELGTHLRSLLLKDLGTGARYHMSCSFCTYRLHLSVCIHRSRYWHRLASILASVFARIACI